MKDIYVTSYIYTDLSRLWDKNMWKKLGRKCPLSNPLSTCLLTNLPCLLTKSTRKKYIKITFLVQISHSFLVINTSLHNENETPSRKMFLLWVIWVGVVRVCCYLRCLQLKEIIVNLKKNLYFLESSALVFRLFR